MKRIALMLLAAGLMAGCLEKSQVAGEYRGKIDAKPYEANFGGDKAKWESALRTRNQSQNEYKRMN